MNSNLRRVALGAAAVAAAVVLLILLKDDGGGGGNDDGEPVAPAGAEKAATQDKRPTQPKEPTIATIVVKAGKPVGGVEELSFEAGEEIRFQVRSDTADELHVHGYDVERELPAGRAVQVEFPASIEGVFEAELHGSGEQVAELRIEP